MTEMKMYAIVSNEAVKASGGNRGKMGAQIGHAYVHSMIDALARFPADAQAYLASGTVGKVCLKADEADLHALSILYKNKCGVYLVKDAGLTVFPRPMITALGIGPIRVDAREPILADLKVWI
jgi:peptidyl-tRNA hydrolase